MYDPKADNIARGADTDLDWYIRHYQVSDGQRNQRALVRDALRHCFRHVPRSEARLLRRHLETLCVDIDALDFRQQAFELMMRMDESRFVFPSLMFTAPQRQGVQPTEWFNRLLDEFEVVDITRDRIVDQFFEELQRKRERAERKSEARARRLLASAVDPIAATDRMLSHVLEEE